MIEYAKTALRMLALVSIYLGVLYAYAGGEEKELPPAKQPAPLCEDWNREIVIPAVKDGENVVLGEAKIKLWVENGWMLVRRETGNGDLEWQIVLAQANAEPPQVAVDKAGGGVEITYGTYFVREAAGVLRVWRERKTTESPAWPKLPSDHQAKGLGNARNGKGVQLTASESGDWCWVGSGLPDGKHDIWLRLEHKDLRNPGFGFQGMHQLARFFFGSRRVQDEGDLLVAERSLAEFVESALLAKMLREEFGSKPAPELAVKEWLNAPAEQSLEKLRGKVILLDFWGKWCVPCVKKLPEIEGLHQKYKDQDLVVIGIHSANDSEDVGDFLNEKNITFAVGVDQGETAKHYAIEAWPTYFLIDKTGKLVWGFSSVPPQEQQIEELLRQPGPPSGK